MKKWDFILGMIWMALGVVIIIVSFQLGIRGIEGFKKPGPGLFPLLVGVTMAGCAMVIIINSMLIFRMRETAKKTPENQEKINMIKVGLVLIYLIGYAFMLETFGYILTTFIIFLLMFKTIGSMKLGTILLTLFLTIGVSYFAFVKLLEVPLPPGIWRIGY